MRFDGLAMAMAQPTGTQQHGDLVIVAAGGEPSGHDTIWIRKYPSDGSSGWTGISHPAGGAQLFRPAVALDGSGCLEIVVAGQDGAVWHARENGPGGGWPTWEPLGKPGGKPLISVPQGAQTPDPAPVLISNQDKRLEIFAVANDFAVWHRQQKQPGSTTWLDWEPLGRPGVQDDEDGTMGPLVAAINADGTLEVFTTTINGVVRHCWQQQPGGDWSGWDSLGSPPGHPASRKLAVIRNGNDQLELFMGGVGAGTVRHRWQQPDYWADWKSLGHPTQGHEHFEVNDVAVGPDLHGGLALFATPDSTASSVPRLFLRSQKKPGDDWLPMNWQALGIPGASTTTKPIEGPVLGMSGIGPVLAVRETGTANIYLVHQDPGGWHPTKLKFETA